MSIGILTPGTNDPQGRLWAEIVALRKRVEALERDSFSAPVVAGVPTGGDNGSLAGDSTNTRLWMKVGGVWRYVTLT